MGKHKKEAINEETNALLQCVRIVLSHDARMADVCDIYRALGADDFATLLHVCGGKTVIFPTAEAFEDALFDYGGDTPHPGQCAFITTKCFL